jgi:predicted RecB family nuclease
MMKITNQTIADFLNCKYKAHLRVAGIAYEPNKYEEFLHHQNYQYIQRGTRELLGSVLPTDTMPDNMINDNDLQGGPALVVNAGIVTDTLAISLHGIKRAPGASSIGDFHYEPVLFSGVEQANNAHLRILLSIWALALEKVQNVRPKHGTLVCGPAHKPHRIKLGSVLARAEKIMGELHNLLMGANPPILRLNEHCRVCGYQSYCQMEARRTDDLSLLRRISER